MNYLYDSRGQQVACEINGLLFSPAGENIGHFVAKAQVFADRNGRYLGEIVCANRLAYNRCTKYRNTSFGPAPAKGNIGARVSLRRCSAMELPPGFEDVRLT